MKVLPEDFRTVYSALVDLALAHPADVDLTGAMLVAVRPILTSDEVGPSRGALLMGRALTASEIKQLSDVTQLTLAIHLPSEVLPSDVQTVIASLSPQHPIVVHPANEQIVQGYTWVNDIQVAYDQLPFGGAKQSGFGKEHGIEAVESYTEKKSVVLGSA